MCLAALSSHGDSQHGDSQPMARCKRGARASGDRVDGECGGACGVAKRTCVHSAASRGPGCAGQCGIAPKGTQSLHWSWSKSRKRLRAPIHGGTWQREMRLGRRLFRTRSQGARESNSQPEPPPRGEVTTRMRLGCSCLVWGTPLFMSYLFVAWRILTFKFERPSHCAESAPCRNFERS